MIGPASDQVVPGILLNENTAILHVVPGTVVPVPM